ncbi:GNAT family N-acetyltransferase [Cupriavidus sp. RAF12]|uniref:GNAT family N-acetyltransferase n=1 Tax=Cupriavidus sp. RAF12 TaxID=3233050 RepID=UPI003F8E89EB
MSSKAVNPVICIRSSAPDDIEPLKMIVRDNDPHLVPSFERDYQLVHVAERLPASGHFLVAKMEHGLVGVTGYRPDAWGARDIWWLTWLYISPKFKRRGIATRLFATAQQELRGLGCRKCYLDVGDLESQRAAVAFHERDGFRLEGTLLDFWASGMHHHIFGKLL